MSTQWTLSCLSLGRSSFPTQPHRHLQPRSSQVTLQETEAPTLSQPLHRTHLPVTPPPLPQALLQGSTSVPRETDRTWLVSIHCHGVQSGGLIICKCVHLKACTCVSRSCRCKQLHLQEGSTLSFFLSGRQTEINQVLSFPRSCCQESLPRGLSTVSSCRLWILTVKCQGMSPTTQPTLPLGSATHLGQAPLFPVFRAIWRMEIFTTQG